MLIRPRPFLTSLIICLAPLLLLALINFWAAVNVVEQDQKRDLQADLAVFTTSVDRILDEAGRDLSTLSESEALQRYIAETRNSSTSASGPGIHDLPLELKALLASILDHRRHFERLICLGPSKQPFFVAEKSVQQGFGALRIYTQDFMLGLPEPPDKVWSLRESTVLPSPVMAASFGASQAYTVPVFAKQDSAAIVRAALVSQLNVDSILAEAARPIEATNGTNDFNSMVIVIDQANTVLYHPNDTLKHQPVATALPSFSGVAQSMTTNNIGISTFHLPDGKEYFAVFNPLPRINSSAAVARSPALALSAVRRTGWIEILIATLIALGAALALTRFRQRQSRGIDKVTKGVTAIAQGELGHHIDVRSGDDARVIADNINLMTERLRGQLAREAEARQFESFVRLSAMLTHDLKNAIEALSLIVGNMEVHFHNEQFRTDVMKSLTLATQKLKALVARITNPVTTLSGEHRRPVPSDLTALLRRVVEMLGEPMRSKYQIDMKLPAPVYALVDAERIEKVIENLIINAFEAMGEGGGKLIVEAGTAEAGRKVFFSVTDTGSGMTSEFIDGQLFRPFATTKKNGVGLGLYTCREVVRANAGTIEVQSKEGVGTSFRIVLPSATVERRN